MKRQEAPSMDKKILKLQDISFYGDKSSSKYHAPKRLTWYRGPDKYPVCFFTDLCLPLVANPEYKDVYKVAWLLEPYVICQSHYDFVKYNHQLFDLVLTHQKQILSLAKNFEYYPNCMCWVDEKDFLVYPKSKNLSIIASNKNYAEGHILRHNFISRYPNIDKFGSGYNFVKDKVDALKDYR